MARYNRDKFIADFKALHGKYERKAYKVFNSALKSQVKPVVDYINTYGAIPSENLVRLLVPKAPMERAYKEVYTAIGVKHAAYTYKNINSLGRSIKSVALFSEEWQRLLEAFFLNESSQRITEVTNTTIERIQRLLADSSTLTISQIASQLQALSFTRPRALTIARTESTAAANYGAMIGNRDADYETNKEWISVLDSRTRRDHMLADGQIVANDELFTVGGERCRFPGDLNLSAKEVINCRCTLAYIPVLDSSGLPLLKV